MIAASLTCHSCFRKQHCKNFLLTSMRVCPFLIIIYTGVSSGSNMSYEPEPERYEWKTVSGKRLPFSLIRIMRCFQADCYYVIVRYVADCTVQKSEKRWRQQCVLWKHSLCWIVKVVPAVSRSVWAEHQVIYLCHHIVCRSVAAYYMMTINSEHLLNNNNV